MSNETDLDWLARNVHVWPADAEFVRIHTNGNEAVFVTKSGAACGGRVFTQSQWLTRRAELQNKPSWDDAPEWAELLAQDDSGEWYWYASKPTHPGMKSWWPAPGANNVQCGKGEVLGDWRDTLEKRPEQAEFEPFVSVEDANPKFPRDVDYVGKINAATAKQPAPKGSGSPILGMVLADLTNRALEGKEKYGEPLLAHNGRNPLWDAYQEALDLAMYLRQAIEELG